MGNSMALRGVLSLLVLISVSAYVWSYALRKDFDILESDTVLRNNSKEVKIVNGTEIKPYSWPFLVLIARKNYKWCGGSVLDSRHILSAAHCYKGSYNVPADFRVIVAEHNAYIVEGKEQSLRVSKITLHPKYVAGKYLHDVAVLTLASDIRMTPQVARTKLNANNECPHIGAICTVAGWGAIYYGGPTSNVPLSVEVPVRKHAVCTEAYYESHGFNGLQNVCAGDTGIDSCQGDSGGPLVCLCGGAYVQVGIVSYGTGCAKPGYPGVYARVSYYYLWILEAMKTA